MRKERNSTSSQDFAATSGNGAAWQNTRRVNPQYTADGQLRISGPVWTIGALATPDGEFRLLVVNRTRNIILALRTVSILGLLILSLGSVAVGQQNSSSRLEQGSTTPDAVSRTNDPQRPIRKGTSSSRVQQQAVMRLKCSRRVSRYWEAV